jgi:hypothetical protein
MDEYKVKKENQGGNIFFDANGQDAHAAEHGIDGAEGIDGGHGTSKNGGDGTDAQSTVPGEAGGHLTIDLTTERKESGRYYVRIAAEAKSMSTGHEMITDDEEYLIPLKELGSIDWTARGGHGGDGGIGGDGGPGGYSAEGSAALRGAGTYGRRLTRQAFA